MSRISKTELAAHTAAGSDKAGEQCVEWREVIASALAEATESFCVVGWYKTCRMLPRSGSGERSFLFITRAVSPQVKRPKRSTPCA